MKKCRHEWHFYEKVMRVMPFGLISGRYAKFICRKCGKVDWVKEKN